VKAVKDLVKIEVTKKNGRVKNMEQKMAEKNLLIAVRKSRCDLKPLKRQIESQEYLVHKRKITEAFLTMIGSVYIPKTY